jgi:isopentenyl phosphate kinase
LQAAEHAATAETLCRIADIALHCCSDLVVVHEALGFGHCHLGPRTPSALRCRLLILLPVLKPSVVLRCCSDLVVVHEALGFGHCHLALGVPMGGKYASVSNLEQLRTMEWTEEQPLRVVTGAL